MSGSWEFTGNNPESRIEARESRGSVGMDPPQQGGWRERQEDPSSPSPSGRGYENYALSTSSYSMARPEQITPGQHLLLPKRNNQIRSNSSRPRARNQRDTALLSSNRVQKLHTACNTHTKVKHHENAPPRYPVPTSQLPPPTIVVAPVTPTPVVKKLHSLLTLRGSQMYPGSSSLRHRRSRSAPYSVRKGAQKVADKRFDRGDPFTSYENSVNKESNQTKLMETREEDMPGLEMGLGRLEI
ncbi:hypothetical protein EAE99_009635 [Botrytis elliptica]|nr:hypothetical protein EAE99_009635 [Botrytis elliptica]